MAVAFVQTHVSSFNKTAGGTILSASVNANGVQAGNLLVFVAVFDNAAVASKPVISSIGKMAGETASWVFLGAARSTSTTLGAFASGEMWAIKTTVAWSFNTTVAATLDTATTMKAAHLVEFSGVDAVLRSTVGTAYSTTTTAASAATTGTTPVVGDLAIGLLFGSNVAAAQAGDTDTLGGAWSTKVDVGSTGGNVATNNYGITQHKILTAASHQTYNNSAAMTAGNGVVVAILQAIPDPAITQAAYGFFADGTESGSAALGSTNAPITPDVTFADLPVQLRVRLQETGSGNAQPTDDWQLQWEKNASGTWSNVTAGSSTVAAYNSASLTDDAFITTLRAGAGTGSPVAGKVSEDGLVTNFGWAQGNYTEHLYSILLKSADLNRSDVLRFRVLRNGATTGLTYSQTPTLTVQKSPTFSAALAVTTLVGAAATAGGPPKPKISTLTDDFTTLDSGKWIPYGTTAIDTGRLKVTTIQSNYSGVATVGSYDLTESAMFVQFTPPPAAVTRETLIAIYKSTDNTSGVWFGTVNSPRSLMMRLKTAGANNDTYLTYDPIAHAYLRVRLTSTLVSWEVSSDGTNWFSVRNDFTAMDLTSVKLELSAGQYAAEADVQPAFYDNLNLLPAAATPAITQAAYRWYTSGSEITGSAAAAQDTALPVDVTLSDINREIRIRLQSTNATAVPTTDDFQLQWEKNGSGTWNNVTPSSSAVKSTTVTLLTDGGGTTNRLTGGTGTFVAGKQSEDGLADNVGWAGNNFTELIYALTFVRVDVVQDDTIRFRVLKNGATTDLTYTQVPTATITRTVYPPISTISSDFTAAQWAPTNVTTTPSRVTFLGASAHLYNSVGYDLTGGQVFCKFAQLPLTGRLWLSVYTGNNEVSCYVEGTNLITYDTLLGERVTVAWDPAKPFVSVRESAGTFYWERSATGAAGTWEVVDSAPSVPTDLVRVEVDLVTTAAATGESWIENLNTPQAAGGGEVTATTVRLSVTTTVAAATVRTTTSPTTALVVTTSRTAAATRTTTAATTALAVTTSRAAAATRTTTTPTTALAVTTSRTAAATRTTTSATTALPVVTSRSAAASRTTFPSTTALAVTTSAIATTTSASLVQVAGALDLTATISATAIPTKVITSTALAVTTSRTAAATRTTFAAPSAALAVTTTRTAATTRTTLPTPTALAVTTTRTAAATRTTLTPTTALAVTTVASAAALRATAPAVAALGATTTVTAAAVRTAAPATAGLVVTVTLTATVVRTAAPAGAALAVTTSSVAAAVRTGFVSGPVLAIGTSMTATSTRASFASSTALAVTTSRTAAATRATFTPTAALAVTTSRTAALVKATSVGVTALAVTTTVFASPTPGAAVSAVALAVTTSRSAATSRTTFAATTALPVITSRTATTSRVTSVSTTALLITTVTSAASTPGAAVPTVALMVTTTRTAVIGRTTYTTTALAVITSRTAAAGRLTLVPTVALSVTTTRTATVGAVKQTYQAKVVVRGGKKNVVWRWVIIGGQKKLIAKRWIIVDGQKKSAVTGTL